MKEQQPQGKGLVLENAMQNAVQKPLGDTLSAPSLPAPDPLPKAWGASVRGIAAPRFKHGLYSTRFVDSHPTKWLICKDKEKAKQFARMFDAYEKACRAVDARNARGLRDRPRKYPDLFTFGSAWFRMDMERERNRNKGGRPKKAVSIAPTLATVEEVGERRALGPVLAGAEQHTPSAFTATFVATALSSLVS